MSFQLIYVKALEEPAIGYEASPKFQRAPFDCPKCGEWVYVRMRNRSRTVIGATCTKCPWISTYLMKTKLPTPPVQTLIEEQCTGKRRAIKRP